MGLQPDHHHYQFDGERYQLDKAVKEVCRGASLNYKRFQSGKVKLSYENTYNYALKGNTILLKAIIDNQENKSTFNLMGA